MADVDSDVFPQLGEAFEKEHPGDFIVGKLGQADCKVVPMKSLVDFGTRWMTIKRELDAQDC